MPTGIPYEQIPVQNQQLTSQLIEVTLVSLLWNLNKYFYTRHLKRRASLWKDLSKADPEKTSGITKFIKRKNSFLQRALREFYIIFLCIVGNR